MNVLGSGSHGVIGANSDKSVIAERVKQQRKGKPLTQKEIQEKIITLVVELERDLKNQSIQNPKEIMERFSTQELDKKLSEFDYEVEPTVRYFSAIAIQRYQPPISHTPRKITLVRKQTTATNNVSSKEIDNSAAEQNLHEHLNPTTPQSPYTNAPIDEEAISSTSSFRRGARVLYNNSDHRRSICITRQFLPLQEDTTSVAPTEVTIPKQLETVQPVSSKEQQEDTVKPKLDELRTIAKRSWSSKIIYK